MWAPVAIAVGMIPSSHETGPKPSGSHSSWGLWKPCQCQGWGMLAGFAESQQLQLSLCCWLWVLALPATWQSPAPHHPVLCSGVKLPLSLTDQSPLPVWTCSKESEEISCSLVLAVDFYKLKKMGFPLVIFSWFLFFCRCCFLDKMKFNCVHFLFFLSSFCCRNTSHRKSQENLGLFSYYHRKTC